MTTLVDIDEIKIKKRIRKDLGDLDALKTSLRTYGLMNPITLSANKELIAGERRLNAAKQIGWTKINAIILDGMSELAQLEMEIEENNLRKEFTDEELLEGYRRLEKLRNPPFYLRLWKWLCGRFAKLSDFFKNLFRKKNNRP
ncbi:MAG: ParB N-terminal domain-containing protein [Treponema sp.]|nr:ParB N-terminal domain-containing protein [Treponema sp.]